MTPAITVEAGVSPALFRDSLQLTGKPLLQKKSEKHKNVATGLASMLQVALQLCTKNHLAGQNLNKPAESHLLLNPPQFASRNVVASNNETATRPQAALGSLTHQQSGGNLCLTLNQFISHSSSFSSQA